MVISFCLDIAPIGKGRPKMSRNGVYTPAKTRAFENALKILSRPYKPVKPIVGPIRLTVDFIFKMPKVKVRDQHTIKPDLDNLLKCFDAFNGIFWMDDSQIVEINSRKLYDLRNNKPRIIVKIESLE